jgi:tRNA G18 (ribose-2'-O)-methylase SpoU
MDARNRWHDWLGDGRSLADAGRVPALALLDNIRSAWNVGSMFRTADATGLAGLVLGGMTPTPPRPDIEKTALGATLTVPWDYWDDPLRCAESLRAAGVPLVAVETDPRATPFDGEDLPFPLCFVVGHEVRGIARTLLDAADRIVALPMAGAKSSLNVAVCFGVVAYEVRRQWRVHRAAAAGGAPAGRKERG